MCLILEHIHANGGSSTTKKSEVVEDEGPECGPGLLHNDTPGSYDGSGARPTAQRRSPESLSEFSVP
jgi:hypothetical protein